MSRTAKRKSAWTKKQPLVAGFYWFRNEDRGPEVVYVFQQDSGVWWRWDCFGFGGALNTYKGEYWGPIQEPPQ